ncbi:sigma-70 family RNA polymerase sigma factor [Paraclostridium bifermentans]|uniref:sigma-70 family RNA polymerase sigma factor n=1 Tax=Paraclostridium bifermentans TaxID=1490 RepID=UPI00359C8401
MHDKDIIEGLINRDEAALSELIDLYGNLIYRASNKVLNNKELSEECLNIVLMKIWEGIEFYNKDKGLFKNWIYTLSKYTAIDIMRKEEKYIKNNFEIKKDLKENTSVEDIILTKEIIENIKISIKNLNDIDKKIFIDRYENDKKVSDIAKDIGKTPKAISLRIMRIKNKLKRYN